ncbi:hypothetical protein CIB48_g5971 [Xylaria polymorpha]|nr:hypothetical protein CIB48_g5971 [Xylaria polymorpha]
MKSTLFSLAVVAAAVSADTVTTTATTTTTACAAEAILDACLDTTEGYVSLCGGQDYSCLCDKYTAIMTCVYVASQERQRIRLLHQDDNGGQHVDTKQFRCDGRRYTTGSAASSTNKATTTTSRGATNTASDDSFTTPSGAAVRVVESGPGLLAAFGLAAAALL